MVIKPLFIRAEWDDEVQVWVASSDDVPGLATEEKTLEGLIQKLKIMIPELLEANGTEMKQEIPFELISRRFEILQGKDV
jgi:predicted RNase H-like HicB family nuclease